MNQLVFIENNRVVTDRLTVAKTFGKEHARVLRDIRELDCSDEFRVGNFAESSYTNGQGREMPKNIITEQGFAFLVMGYTGKEAARFKEMYIMEFNRMRQELSKPDPQRLIAMALIEAQKVIEAKDEQIAIMKPKAEFFDAVADSKTAIDIGTAAKVLKIPGIGRNNLFERLRQAGILMNNNQPYQKYIDAGYFRIIEQKYRKPDGSTHISIKTLVYQKGPDFIRRTMEKVTA